MMNQGCFSVPQPCTQLGPGSWRQNPGGILVAALPCRHNHQHGACPIPPSSHSNPLSFSPGHVQPPNLRFYRSFCSTRSPPTLPAPAQTQQVLGIAGNEVRAGKSKSMFDPSPGRYSQLGKKLSEAKLIFQGCTVLLEGPRVLDTGLYPLPCCQNKLKHLKKLNNLKEIQAF